MAFNTYSYLFTLALAVSVYWALPGTARRWFLLALSIAFYAMWKPILVLVPVGISIGVFLGGVQIARQHRNQKIWFCVTVAFCLTVWVFFRYREWTMPWFSELLTSLRFMPARTALTVSLPLGISFYTFEAISYLIDVRQERVQPERFSDLLLFILFWPHLIAGPIVRFRELVPQFKTAKAFELQDLVRGLDRLIWGLVQKNLIADSLARWIDEGFLPASSGANTFIDNWALAVAFGLQVYFDFAAYSNMAIGTASLLGIRLPENFRFPYHAKTPAEFWQRWHMTLSRWIRDYLFFPMNVRFRGSPLPLYISLIGIMALVGLWHGIGCGFVIWGMLHGLYLVAYRAWEKHNDASKTHRSSAVRWTWQLFTIFAVTVAWVPFRATSFQQTERMLRTMFFHPQLAISYPVNFYLVTLLIAAFVAVEPWVCSGFKKFDEMVEKTATAAIANTYVLRPLLYGIGLMMFMIFDERDTRFIYFQF